LTKCRLFGFRKSIFKRKFRKDLNSKIHNFEKSILYFEIDTHIKSSTQLSFRKTKVSSAILLKSHKIWNYSFQNFVKKRFENCTTYLIEEYLCLAENVSKFGEVEKVLLERLCILVHFTELVLKLFERRLKCNTQHSLA
jgi:hypothetical protein